MLEEFEFFNTLPKQLQQRIAIRGRRIEYEDGDIVYEQGESAEYMILVLHGGVQIFRHHESGQQITLYTLSTAPGHNIDMGTLDSEACTIGTAEAIGATTLLLIPVRELFLLLASDTAFHHFVFGLVTRRTQIMAEMVEAVRFMKLDERVLQWLQEAPRRYLYMTHEQIASYHGTSREVISRMLKKFELQGYIKISRKMIEVMSA